MKGANDRLTHPLFFETVRHANAWQKPATRGAFTEREFPLDTVSVHRPRNVDWKRAAALLYGDWGTSKAYVIGLAFVAAQYSSLPIILAVCALTAVVAYNYLIICNHFPDGGGVYSAARDQSRLLAVIGALLLVADLTVTASLSGWSALRYLGLNEHVGLATVVLIFGVAVMNAFGPKHSGSIAFLLAIPMVLVVLLIVGLSLPFLTTVHLEPSHSSFSHTWVAFAGVILALSGVEAIANLTGVMKLDPGSTPDEPRVKKTARLAILPIAAEVVLGTALLGWAMLSLPHENQDMLLAHKEDMLRFLGEFYGGIHFGPVVARILGIVIGAIVGLLLLSAVNTAVVALIGLTYMMGRDGEMPRQLTRLNRYGVPWIPLLIATLLPIVVVLLTSNFDALAALYAIGVVGAITLNLGSCTFNKKLKMHWYERILMGFTALILLFIEITIAKTKPDALFFALWILIVGLSLRAYAQKRAGLQTLLVHKDVAAVFSPEAIANMKLNVDEGQKVMVAARGLTPVVRYALEEAHLRKGALYVLYVKELAVAIPSNVITGIAPRWQDDSQAAAIIYGVKDLAKKHGVPVIPLYAVSEDPAVTIVDLAATMGIDFLMLGASNRRFMTQLLKGDVIAEVARDLPDNIQLVIHG